MIVSPYHAIKIANALPQAVNGETASEKRKAHHLHMLYLCVGLYSDLKTLIVVIFFYKKQQQVWMLFVLIKKIACTPPLPNLWVCAVAGLFPTTLHQPSPQN